MDATEQASDRLTHKQRLFVEAYIRLNGNATRAALAAGYKPAAAYATGYENLKKPQIREAINEHYRAGLMDTEEVLNRLAEQARNAIEDYTERGANGDLVIDTERLLADGKAHLIRGIKYDRRGNQIIETFDAQAALVQVGRNLKLFTDRQEVDVPGIDAAIERALAQLAGGEETGVTGAAASEE